MTIDVFSQRLALTSAYVHAEGLTEVGDLLLARSDGQTHRSGNAAPRTLEPNIADIENEGGCGNRVHSINIFTTGIS